MSRTRSLVAACAIIVASFTGWAEPSLSSDDLSVADLVQHTHFHGIAVNPTDPSKIYLATHHGFFVVSLDGRAQLLSDNRNDYMGFTPHPSDPSVLFASGHPASGGNWGFVVSNDGGKTWRQRSKGVGGPVDFHQMSVTLVDPNILYGAYDGVLQVSRDGGHSWKVAGAAPDGLIDLSASAKDIDRLYAATQTGIRLSEDGGKTWRNAFSVTRPATMIETTPDGQVYAFVANVGLIQGSESDLAWQTLASGWGDIYLLHLAVDPTDKSKLYAIASRGGILASGDGGKTWSSLGATDRR
jgi:hypothetical protein